MTAIDQLAATSTPAITFTCTVFDRIKRFAFGGFFSDFVLAFFILPRVYLPAAIPVACLLPFFIFMAFAPSRVIVGDDGIQWKHFVPFLKPRFVSYGEITAILPNTRGCAIALQNGQTVQLQTSTTALSGVPLLGTDAARRATAWHGHLLNDPLPSALEEAPGGPYRSSTDSNALLSIVAMPHAAAASRISAARKLGPGICDEIRQALRRLSLGVAEPNLRHLLETLAGEGDGRDT